jgi:hypothetical protein
MTDSGAIQNGGMVVKDFPMLEQAYFTLNGRLYQYSTDTNAVAIRRMDKTLVLHRAELAIPEEIKLSIVADAARIEAYFYPNACKVDDFV